MGRPRSPRTTPAAGVSASSSTPAPPLSLTSPAPSPQVPLHECMRSRHGARLWIQPEFINCNLTQLRRDFPDAHDCWGGGGLTTRQWSTDQNPGRALIQQ